MLRGLEKEKIEEREGKRQYLCPAKPLDYISYPTLSLSFLGLKIPALKDCHEGQKRSCEVPGAPPGIQWFSVYSVLLLGDSRAGGLQSQMVLGHDPKQMSFLIGKTRTII